MKGCDIKMNKLCGNIMCRFQSDDECFSNEDVKLVPYTFSEDISNSIDNCKGYKLRSGGIFNNGIDKRKKTNKY